MIDLLLERAGDPAAEEDLVRDLAAHVAAVRDSARGGDRWQVAEIEAAVREAPAEAITFDDAGRATLTAGERSFPAGRFEVASLGALRARCLGARAKHPDADPRARLWVLDGASPATDIGALQAGAGPGTLFQVASQFNCLESPGPFVTPIARYFGDPTQGPRASISAFPGTFVRHYAAPGVTGVTGAEAARTIQATDAPQIDLLGAVCGPGVARVRNGYLRASTIDDPDAFAAALESRFDDICVGVHDEVPVVLGYDWDGAVEGAGERRIGQVFTSTVAGGIYGRSRMEGPLATVYRQLLRAAYLGTLLAAASLGRDRVVLTLVGGGAFGNPVPLIWEAILWALGEAERCAPRSLDVVVNGRNLGSEIDDAVMLDAVRARGGVLVAFDQPDKAEIYR